jgi:hypothetical protein
MQSFLSQGLLAIIVTALTVFSPFSTTLAQNARPTEVSFMKGKQLGLVADYDFHPGTVEAALKERLEKAGLSNRSSTKGFISYKGITWPEIGPDKMDVYTRVDGKGEKSTVTLLVSKGYNNFISEATDEQTVMRLKMFLNDFLVDATAYNLRLAIKRQEEVVQLAERDMRDKAKSGEDLAQEMKRLQQRMEETEQSRKKLETTLEDQRSKLISLQQSAPKS